MKGTLKYLLALTAFMALLFVLQLQLPSRFSWSPTYSYNDPNPFGCYVFDSVMGQTMPHGYRATGATLRQVARDTALHNVLIIDKKFELTRQDVAEIRRLLARGSTVMLVGGHLRDSLMMASFNMSCTAWGNFYLQGVKEKLMAKNLSVYDTLYYEYNDGKEVCDSQKTRSDRYRYPYAEYRCLYELLDGYVEIDEDSLCHHRLVPLSYVKKNWYVKGKLVDGKHRYQAVQGSYGKGKLVLVSSPLMFTNYGILDRQVHPYIIRLMNILADKLVLRLDANISGAVVGSAADKHNRTVFTFIAEHAPLKWAYYTMLAGVVLFFIFTARRRQRVIPVIPEPQNNDMEFVKLIGKLYFERRDNADLVLKKYMAFTDIVRTELDVDLTDYRRLKESVKDIADATGMDEKVISRLVTEIREMREERLQVSDADMIRLINRINEIAGKL